MLLRGLAWRTCARKLGAELPGSEIQNELEMRHKIFSGSFFSAVLLLATLLAAGIRAQAATPKDSPQVTKLLEDIKTQAADLQKDSDELESFTHSDLSWESHAEELHITTGRIT